MKVSSEYFSTKLLHISKVYYQGSFLFEGQMNNLFISVIKHVLLHLNIYSLDRNQQTLPIWQALNFAQRVKGVWTSRGNYKI